MKKKVCKYCEIESTTEDCNDYFLMEFIPFGLDERAFGISAVITREADIKIWVDDGYTGRYIANHYIPIHFCPFCGRKLRKENTYENVSGNI